MPYNQKIRFKQQHKKNSHLYHENENEILRRYQWMIFLIVFFSVVFITRLFVMQIAHNSYYEEKLNTYSSNTFRQQAQRGEMTDRQYQKLVYNKNVVCATYYPVQRINDEQIRATISFLMKHCSIGIDDITTRQKKDFLIQKDPDYVKSLISEKELNRLKEYEDYASRYYQLQLEKITKAVLKKRLSDDDIRYYYLYNLMKNTKRGSATLIEGLSAKEASLIAANQSLLKGVQVTSDYQRCYLSPEMKSVFGTLTTKKQGLPATFKTSYQAMDYKNDDRVGTSGLEYQYEDVLKGQSSLYELNYSDEGDPIVTKKSEGHKGDNIQLTIDWDIQEALGKYITKELLAHKKEKFNDHAYVIVSKPKTGEIIAMVGKYYNRKTGKVEDAAAGNYLNAYRIGSTMKTAVLYTCFKEGIIGKNHFETDTEKGLKIAGTKTKYSHNKKGFGKINEINALAYSSNIYMMKIMIKLGEGTYRYNKPLKINPVAFTKLRNGAGELGLGVKSGLDVPYESLGYRGTTTNAGNLLDFAIGQYDTYTNIQLATLCMTLANNGVRVQPHLYQSSFVYDGQGDVVTTHETKTHVIDNVSSEKTAFSQIKKGMKAVVDYGTASSGFKGFSWTIAGKTGTAEDYTDSGNTDYPNHLFLGYGPYKDPEICVSVVVERQKKKPSHLKIAKKAFSLYFKKYGIKPDRKIKEEK